MGPRGIRARFTLAGGRTWASEIVAATVVADRGTRGGVTMLVFVTVFAAAGGRRASEPGGHCDELSDEELSDGWLRIY